VAYPKHISLEIEKVFVNKTATAIKVDDHHFVDLSDMVQKRYDDNLRIRYILRKIPEKQIKAMEATVTDPATLSRIQKNREAALKLRQQSRFRQQQQQLQLQNPQLAQNDTKKENKNITIVVDSDSEDTQELDSLEKQKFEEKYNKKPPLSSSLSSLPSRIPIDEDEDSSDTQEMLAQDVKKALSKNDTDDEQTRKELEYRRSRYKCGNNYVLVSKIETWKETLKSLKKPIIPSNTKFSVSPDLNSKVSLWIGDITHMEIDAIVNAAKATLLGGGGIDGAIHKAAGHGLLQECSFIGGCNPGHSRITQGYKLPARHVIHTVGPIGEKPHILKQCYISTLRKVIVHNLKTIAFCCISTGIYGYPNEPAAHVALKTIRKWLERDNNHEKIERIIFCIFLPADYKIYKNLMQTMYFPG